MKELSDWLKSIEHSACDTYRTAADYFKGNESLQTFLRHLSNDEAWHYHLMGSASDHYSSQDPPAEIAVDDETKRSIESDFAELSGKISAGTLTEEDVLRSVIRSEFSEWNDIFLYVVNNLAAESYEFSFAVTKIQQHMKYIEGYLDGYEQSAALKDEFRKIAPVWEKRVLIVEDADILAKLMESIVKKESLVDLALNGKDAFDMIRNTSYDLVIADIMMPVMDGIALFRKVEAEYPDLVSRFIFHTGDAPPELDPIIRKYNIPCLKKPTRLSQVREAVREALQREPRGK